MIETVSPKNLALKNLIVWAWSRGQLVCILAFHFNDRVLNLADYCKIFTLLCIKMEINIGPFLKGEFQFGADIRTRGR